MKQRFVSSKAAPGGLGALGSPSHFVRVCLLGPRCCRSGLPSLTPTVSPPALLGDDLPSLPGSGRLFSSPGTCPAQSEAVKSLPWRFFFSGISQALLHSFFCPFHDFLFFSPLLLFMSSPVPCAVVSCGGFLHQKLLQYLGNSSVPGVQLYHQVQGNSSTVF